MSELQIGQILANDDGIHEYKITRFLGRGNYGAVYEATCKGQKYAVKYQTITASEAEYLKREEELLRAISKLKNPYLPN